MKFREFWKKLHGELGCRTEYQTLKRSRPFKATAIDSSTIIITPGSNQDRPVPVGQFEGMWNLMKDDVRSQRYVNTKTNPKDPDSKPRYYSYWSFSYICALIDHVVADQDME